MELLDGTILQVDLLILGVGSTLNTEWLKGSGVKLLDDGSVEVNKVFNLKQLLHIKNFLNLI